MSSATPRSIRLGVIGTGLAVEQLHWPALRQMPGRFAVAAFSNHTRQKAEHFASYSGASMDDYHEDYRDLLRRDDVEAVLISLPIPLNYAVTREALAAGKDVVCEKPAGANPEEAEAFLRLPEEFPGRTILIAENFFYRDDLRLARSLLDAGAIGRLHLLNWRNISRLVPRPGTFSSTPWRHDPGYLGGPHLDAGVHHTAQIRLLCGDVERVQGEIQDANATHGGPSDLTLNLRFASGAVGNYTAAYPELELPPEPNELRLYGDAATMVLTRNQVVVHRPGGAIEEHRLVDGDGGYYNEFLNFYEAVVHGAPIVGTIAQSYRNLRIIARGLESAERGATLATDDAGVTEGAGVPLWRPHGATGLFDGLPGRIISETRQA